MTSRGRWAAGALGVLVAAMAPMAQAMRCGTHLVSVGDSAYRLQRLCGAPAHKVRYEVVEYRRVPDRLHGGWTLVPVTVTRERLTYDLGRTHFLRIVTIQGGVIVHIETGERPP